MIDDCYYYLNSVRISFVFIEDSILLLEGDLICLQYQMSFNDSSSQVLNSKNLIKVHLLGLWVFANVL